MDMFRRGIAVAALGMAACGSGTGGGPNDAPAGQGDARRLDAGPLADGRLVDARPLEPDAAFPDVDAAPADARTCATRAFVMDGVLDDDIDTIAGGVTSPRLLVAYSDDGILYVATDDAGEGSDHFLLLSASLPGTDTLPAPFAKAGVIARGPGDVVFLADENDNDFAGWFRSNAKGGDTFLAAGVTVATGGNGGVLEGTIDVAALFGAVPPVVYLAVGVYGNGDGGLLVASAQTPDGNDDGNIDAAEYATVGLDCATP